MFGDRTSPEICSKIVNFARNNGVNFIDTADVYSAGESERITGNIIRRDRNDWVLATKVGSPMSKNLLHRGIGRKWIMKACDDSLKRSCIWHWCGANFEDLIGACVKA